MLRRALRRHCGDCSGWRKRLNLLTCLVVVGLAFGSRLGGPEPAVAAARNEAVRTRATHAGARISAPPHGRFVEPGHAEPGRGPSNTGRGPADHAAAATAHAPQGRSRSNESSPNHAAGPERNPGVADRRAASGIARNGLPSRPFPGQPGFTGVPPQGETRFVTNEMVVHVGADVSAQALDAAARRLGLSRLASRNLSVTGGTLVHFRLDDGRNVADVVRALEAERIGMAQPNYVYRLQQDPRTETALPKGDPGLPKGDPGQYVIAKLQLAAVHRIASGNKVRVAVIDSRIDAAHPELSGSIAGQFDTVNATDKPDEHGTGMAGAIVAHRRLLGIAPRASILAVHAFSPNAETSAQATTQNIVAGIDWAVEQGARIINMSFAGPYDPMLQVALQKAHDKGVVLIAAAGNMGPRSPPLYPAADENVIAVTAVDENEKLLPAANQGPHIALAAPGVNILDTVPRGAYGFTTGTSVASAHVSGVAALILERNPTIDVATLEDILFSTAKDLGQSGRDSQFGFGLVDPYRALNALEAKVIANRIPRGGTASTGAPPIAVATTSDKPPIAPTVRGPAADRPPAPAASPASSPPPAPAPGKLTVDQSPPLPSPTVAALKPVDSPSTVQRRRLACRAAGVRQGLRDPEIRDYADACVAEARVACLKQAIAQKIQGPDRQDFVNRCLAP